MSGAKEIRTKIRSIQNTRKITTAMEMVAASKMRKAQQRMDAARPYADKMRQVIGHLEKATPEYRHPYMVARETHRVGYIVVCSDRGLCGGLNANLLRHTVRAMREHDDAGLGVDVCTIGAKGSQFFSRMKTNLVAETSGIGDNPHVEDLIGNVGAMLNAFEEARIDRLVLAYNGFVNAMTQRPTLETLLPLPKIEADERAHSWDYLYEPAAPEVLDVLLRRYVESLVYQSVVENIACEQAARMVAMKAASDNAGKLIDELQLAYNKARQAAITTELTEIVSGAAAV